MLRSFLCWDCHTPTAHAPMQAQNLSMWYGSLKLLLCWECQQDNHAKTVGLKLFYSFSNIKVAIHLSKQSNRVWQTLKLKVHCSFSGKLLISQKNIYLYYMVMSILLNNIRILEYKTTTSVFAHINLLKLCKFY